MDTVVAIPKKITSRGDLVVIPRSEYRALLELKRFQGFKPTQAQKKSLARAENNLRRGKTLSYNELVEKLGFAN